MDAVILLVGFIIYYCMQTQTPTAKTKKPKHIKASVPTETVQREVRTNTQFYEDPAAFTTIITALGYGKKELK